MRDRFRLEGKKVNLKRIQRLMRLMGIEALYPKRKLSRPHSGHRCIRICSEGTILTIQIWSGVLI